MSDDGLHLAGSVSTRLRQKAACRHGVVARDATEPSREVRAAALGVLSGPQMLRVVPTALKHVVRDFQSQLLEPPLRGSSG